MQPSKITGYLASLIIVILIAVASNQIEKVPIVKYYGIEFVVWAVLIGIIVGNIGLPQALKASFRSELFIKVGLVLLGASVNFTTLMAVGVRGLLQAVVIVSAVLLFALILGLRLGLDKKLSAVLATGVSVCGVSAAIAAAGAVLAKKEHLTYVVTMVVAFAVPLMFIQPLIARLLQLPDPVAGAWIGGNIDTTAVVVAAGSLYSPEALKVASVVKMSQNALIGLVAFMLSLYYALYVERHEGLSGTDSPKRPSPMMIWERFPKFVLGFILVSILSTVGLIAGSHMTSVDAARKWAFAMAFASIGLSFNLKEFRILGGKPLLVFLLATIFNLFLAYGAAWLFFGNLLHLQ
ncbi:MAG: putative sulfate exporter family transporter [Candidatus Bathyarchaeia archaeon]